SGYGSVGASRTRVHHRLVIGSARTWGTRSAACRLADQVGEDDRAVAEHGAYSITSSARASSEDWMARPIALAVLRLMTRSTFVGCSTGSSAAFAPRSRRST